MKNIPLDLKDIRIGDLILSRSPHREQIFLICGEKNSDMQYWPILMIKGRYINTPTTSIKKIPYGLNEYYLLARTEESL